MSAPAPESVPTSTAVPLPGAAPSALSGVINRMKEASAAVMKQQKPWSEVFDRTVIAKPASFGEVGQGRANPSLSHALAHFGQSIALVF